MYKLICSLMIVAITLTPILPAQRAQASGIPVVDVAHISQSIVGYVQQLADYVEALQQTALTNSQLTQMITDYTQVLREYEHYLMQLRQLQDVLSPEQWEALVTSVEREIARISDISLTEVLDPQDDNYEAELRELLASQGLAAPVPEDVTDFYQDELNVPADELAAMKLRLEALNKQYLRYAAQQENVALNKKTIQDFGDDLVEATDTVASLGEESDLATLQMIAHLQLKQMEQQQLILDLQNQQLQLYEPTSVLISAQQARSVEREKQRLKKSVNRENTGVGYSNFADEYDL